MPNDFRIGGWLVQPSLNRLTRGDRQVRLEPKVMQVLEVLAEHPGQVISRDDLVARVWADVFVTDDVLHRAVRELRRAFDDDPVQPRFIETIRKRGYRLVAEVTQVERQTSRLTAGSVVGSAPAVRPPAGVAPWPNQGWRLAPSAVFVGVGMMAVAAALAWRPAAVETEAHVTFAVVAAGPGNEAEPAISPDGRRLAYIVRALPESGEATHVYLSGIAGDAPRQITEVHAEHRAPAWSHDGTMLAYSRYSPDGGCDLMVRALAGGSERRVRTCTNPWEPRLDWAADGGSLYVSLARVEGGHRGWQIARLDIETGEAQPITFPSDGLVGDHSPRLSPDGRLVAFIRTVGGARSEIYTVRTIGGLPAPLTTDHAGIAGFDWSQRGDEVVYSSARAGGYSLWRTSLAGGSPRLVAGGAARLKHPAVSRADDRVVYESWAYEINLWEAPAGEARAAYPLTTASELWHFFPQVSPDGTRLAFTSNRTGRDEVWIAARDGRDPRQLTDFRGGYTALPRWSPDGQTLVVQAQIEGQSDIHLVDANTGDARRLTSDPGAEVAPSWSRDGRRVYFGALTAGEWQVWRIDVTTGQREQVTTAGGYAAQESADGREVFFTRADGRGLWRQPLRDGAPSLVLESMSAGAWANWQVHEDGIYVLRADANGEAMIMRERWNGGTEPVRSVPRWSWPGFALAPDGGVIYARWDRRESNLLALESR